MHTELSSFLTNVWENRENILFSRADETGITVEDRVYTIYAPLHGVSSAGISQDQYGWSLDGIRKPAGSAWAIERGNAYGDEFLVWKNGAAVSRSVDHRIYINAKLATAATVFQRILTEAARQADQHATSVPMSVMATSYQALASRGRLLEHLPELVVAAKIASKEAAFTGRQDLIVVYLNKYGGRALAEAFGKKIATWGSYFRNDHVPMTLRVASGISIGPEGGADQLGAGASFGQVRCWLIARALIRAVTNTTPTTFENKVPLRLPSVPSPNRLDFNRIAGQEFQANGIDVNAPWT